MTDNVTDVDFKSTSNDVKEKEGILSKIKGIIMVPVNFVIDSAKKVYSFLNEKLGNYSSALWIVVGILALTLVSPAAGFSAFMFVLSLAVYITIFIVLWNIINEAFVPATA